MQRTKTKTREKHEHEKLKTQIQRTNKTERREKQMGQYHTRENKGEE